MSQNSANRDIFKYFNAKPLHFIRVGAGSVTKCWPEKAGRNARKFVFVKKITLENVAICAVLAHLKIVENHAFSQEGEGAQNCLCRKVGPFVEACPPRKIL